MMLCCWMCGIRYTAVAIVEFISGHMEHSNKRSLLLQVFVWIGKDANEVERTKSVSSGEFLVSWQPYWISSVAVLVNPK